MQKITSEPYVGLHQKFFAMSEKYIEELHHELVLKYELVGSRAICDGKYATEDSDYDYLVLLKPKLFSKYRYKKYLKRNRFFYDFCRNYIPYGSIFELGEGFFSIKRSFEPSQYTIKDLNLIVTCSESFYSKFLTATEACTVKNIKTRKERIDIHKKILYGHKNNA